MSVFRFDGYVNTSQGVAISGCNVYVCTQPAITTTNPPSPLASLFTDATGATPLANPVQTDGNGNYFFYAAQGVYTLVYIDPLQRIFTQVFPDQQVVSPGGGSVTSVALTTPAEFTVTGSPIINSGTLAIAKANQSANLVYAGPASGGAAAPTFRTIVVADLPAGFGTVTSITLAIVAGTLFTGSITGTNPITTNGTVTVNIDLAVQPANTVLAGPASGGSGSITARKLVAADIFGVTVVSFSATPVFDASTFAFPTFDITLTGNVSSSSVSNPTTGQQITFIIRQDATGSRTFAFPANFKGTSNILPSASGVSLQSFVYDGTSWRATSAGSTNPS